MRLVGAQWINIIFITTTALVRSAAQTKSPRAKEKMRIDMTDEAQVLAALVLKAYLISTHIHLHTMPRQYFYFPNNHSSKFNAKVFYCTLLANS